MVTHTELDNRLKQLIDRYMPKRGKFSTLAGSSGLSESKWKNFYYEKQGATQEMVDYWCTRYPNEADWLLTGEEPPDKEDFPFFTRIPKRSETQTISDRLIWLIAQFAEANGENLLSYLEADSHGRIKASEWSKMIMKVTPPTAEMVHAITQKCPFFTEWIIHGTVKSSMQVDPSNIDSVNRWREECQKEHEYFLEIAHGLLDDD